MVALFALYRTTGVHRKFLVVDIIKAFNLYKAISDPPLPHHLGIICTRLGIKSWELRCVQDIECRSDSKTEFDLTLFTRRDGLEHVLQSLRFRLVHHRSA